MTARVSDFLISRVCPVCSKEFTVERSRLKHGRGVHCSKDCQYIANRTKLSKPKVTLICIGCGEEFEILPSKVASRAGAGKFCTRACRDTHWKGDITPNWQTGNGVYKRGPNWQSTKRAVLKRDNNECQQCGAAGPLHVHHKIPFRMFDDYRVANDQDNLISLCPPCHRKEDALRKWVKVGDSVIMMGAGSYAWELARTMMANDNIEKRASA